MLCCLQSPCFFDLLTLLRLSMAKSKIALGKCHIALENMWVIFKYLLILIYNIIPRWLENRLQDFNTFRPSSFCTWSYPLDMLQCLLVYSLWELDRICILMCENCINLNYTELAHSVFKSTILFYFSVYSFYSFLTVW